MAVYTEVSDEDLTAFATDYGIGEVLSCKGIAEGIENTNYLVETEAGRFILTLYEKRVKRSDLPFYLGLMEHLAGKGIPCPTPLRTRDGEVLRELCGRPAVMVSFLPGMWPKRPGPAHCAALGEALQYFGRIAANCGGKEAGRDQIKNHKNTRRCSRKSKQ